MCSLRARTELHLLRDAAWGLPSAFTYVLSVVRRLYRLGTAIRRSLRPLRTRPRRCAVSKSFACDYGGVVSAIHLRCTHRHTRCERGVASNEELATYALGSERPTDMEHSQMYTTCNFRTSPQRSLRTLSSRRATAPSSSVDLSPEVGFMICAKTRQYSELVVRLRGHGGRH